MAHTITDSFAALDVELSIEAQIEEEAEQVEQKEELETEVTQYDEPTCEVSRGPQRLLSSMSIIKWLSLLLGIAQI